MVGFEGLPTELRDRIYDFLLDGKECKIATDDVATHDYKFHTAIMRVNKLIHGEAHAAFYNKNHFVLVSSNLGPYAPEANGSLIRTFRKSISKIKSYHLRLHITARPAKRGFVTQYTTNFFVIPAMEIPELVHFLRVAEACNAMSFRFQFEIKASFSKPLEEKIQRRLLEPFKLVRGPNQKCSVKGEVEATVTASVVTAMTPRLYRAIDVSWEFYDLSRTLMARANDSFSAGNADQSLKLYMLLKRVIEQFDPAFKPEITLHRDYHESIHRLLGACYFNSLHVSVINSRKGMNQELAALVALTLMENRPAYMNDEFSTIENWLDAIVNFELQDYRVAVECMNKAVGFAPRNSAVKETRDAFKAWHALPKSSRSTVEADKIMNRAIATLPNHLLSVEPVQHEEVHDIIHMERNLLHKLGYVDYHPEYQAMLQPGICFPDKVSSKMIEDMEKEMEAGKSERGKMPNYLVHFKEQSYGYVCFRLTPM